jgi:hypothetical protein
VAKRGQKRQLFFPFMIWEMKGTSPMFRVWEIAVERYYKNEVRKRLHDKKKLLGNKQNLQIMHKVKHILNRYILERLSYTWGKYDSQGICNT